MKLPQKLLLLRICWAKTAAVGSDDVRPVRSELSHGVQAGAVAEVVFSEIGPSAMLPLGLVTLTAAHDIGKIAAEFLCQCQAWLRRLDDETRAWLARLRSQENSGKFLHAAASLQILADFGGLRGGLGLWAQAVGGHHGRFTVKPMDTHRELEAWAGPARRECLQRMIELFGPLPKEAVGSAAPDRIERLLVATGFIIVCDWLASDETLFRFGAPEDFGKPEDPHALLREARPLAKEAVRRRLQWHTGALQTGAEFNEYSGVPSANGLQRAVLAHVLTPGLYVLEAPMGMGKTEAAFAAAYQLISSGQARGFYFALPTRLTSDRIHERLGRMLSAVLEEPVEMPVVHAAAWIREPADFRFQPSGDGEDGLDATAAATWFTSRRALLACYGVGTIDQALMATLPVRFCALRAFGLVGKVVILDEVHTYDSYTGTVLDVLAARLLLMGCTVLVLSATLTRARKQALLSACGGSLPPLPEQETEPYPLLTCLRAGETVAQSVEVETAPEETNPRAVSLEHFYLDSPLLLESLLEAIADRAHLGRCVLVIRNTVALAQETFRQLSGAVCQGIEIGLLHSRMPYFIRNGRPGDQEGGREDLWVSRLGKDRALRPQHGCILVATQVCEQSLDIDADLLVTDLCPGDALFQRLGRLFRHREKRAASAQSPEAWILHPVLPADEEPDIEKWRKALKPHGNIYAPAVLLRTWRQWRKEDSVALPADIRPWLEAIYDEAAPLPPAWVTLDQECQADARRLRGFAEGFASNPCSRPPTRDNEDHVPTRWNERPEREVILLSERPRLLPGGRMEIRFLDGSTHTFVHWEPWERAKAVTVFINTVRVPLYTARGESTPWLKPYSFQAPLALWTDEHGQFHECTEGNPTALWFTNALGLFHQPERHKPPQDEASILDLELSRDESVM